MFLSLGYLGYRVVSDRFAIPQVVAANFSTEYRRIPYNTKTIDVTFSIPLDPASVSKESAVLAPGIEGSVSVVRGNTISYTL